MHRTLELHFRGDASAIPVTLSTEYAVDRGDYLEVLEHTERAVDLSRGDLPVIEAHDNSQVNIGIVEQIRLVGRKLKGVLRLGSSARAKELLADIQAKVVRNVSVGYSVAQWRESDEGDVMIATRWSPHELSLVAAGADPGAQLYRGIDMSDQENVIDVQNTRRGKIRAREVAKQETDRIEGIRSIAAIHNREDVIDCGEKCIADGVSVEVARVRMLNALGGTSQPLGGDFNQSPYRSDIPRSEQREYSLLNAINAMVDPGSGVGGYERECSEQFERQTGRKASRGLMVPFDQIKTRALTKGGTGSSTIEQTLLDGDFIDILRARSAILSQPITNLTGNVGDLRIPKLDGSATAFWFAGDDSDSISESTPTLTEVPLAPHPLGGLVTYSHLMLRQGTPTTESIIRDDLAQVLATEVDLQAFAGDGTGNVPLGILNTPNITSVVDATPDWASIVQLEADLVAANADIPSMGYAVAAGLLPTLKTTAKDTGSGLFLWDSSTSYSGRMNGYPAMASNQITAGHILFAAWKQFLFATWGGLELEANPYTRFAQGSVQVRAIMDIDFAVRHPASFSVITPA